MLACPYTCRYRQTNNGWKVFGRPDVQLLSEEDTSILESACGGEVKYVKSYPKAYFKGLMITTLSHNRSSNRNDFTITYQVDGCRKLYGFIDKMITCCTSSCSNESTSHAACHQLLLVVPLIEANEKIPTDEITNATLPHLKQVLLSRYIWYIRTTYIYI